jgi:hypothetical protein
MAVDIELFESTIKKALRNTIRKEKLLCVNLILILIECSHLGAANPVKKCEDQLRRKILDLRTRGSKFIEVGGGVLEYFLLTVTYLSLLC